MAPPDKNQYDVQGRGNTEDPSQLLLEVGSILGSLINSTVKHAKEALWQLRCVIAVFDNDAPESTF